MDILVPTFAKFQAGMDTVHAALSKTINFVSPFQAVPKVIVMPKQDMGNIRWWVQDVSVNSFTLRMSFTSTKTFDWVAIEF